MIKNIALVAGFCLISPLLFAREITGENESYIPSILLDEPSNDSVLFITNITLNQCHAIDKPCKSGQNNYLSIAPVPSIEYHLITNRMNDFIDSQRANTQFKDEALYKSAIFPEEFLDPFSDAGFLAFSLNHKDEKRVQELFFIEKMGMDNCNLINKACINHSNYPAISPSYAEDLIAYLKPKDNTLFKEDIFSQKMALLPTNLEESWSEKPLMVFDAVQDQGVNRDNIILYIDKTALNRCLNIKQDCAFTTKAMPQVAPEKGLEHFLVADQTADLFDKQRFDYMERKYVQKIALLPKSYIPSLKAIPVVDVGFIVQLTPSQSTELTFVGSWQNSQAKGHYLNFDGNNLIYFDPQAALNYHVAQNGDFGGRVKFSREGRIVMDKATKDAILGNVINTKGIAEANHISIKNNHIVLNKKPVMIRNQPANKYHLTKTLSTINTHSFAVTQEDYSQIQWVRQRRFGF